MSTLTSTTSISSRSMPWGLVTESSAGDPSMRPASRGPAPMAAKNPAASAGGAAVAGAATRSAASTMPFQTARWAGRRTASVSLGVRVKSTAAACSTVSSCGPAGSSSTAVPSAAVRTTTSGRSTVIGPSGSSSARSPASSTCWAAESVTPSMPSVAVTWASRPPCP